MLTQNSVTLPRTPSFPPQEPLILGPGPSNHITALILQDAQSPGATSRPPLPWVPRPPTDPPIVPSWPFRDPHLALPSDCPLKWTGHIQSNVLQGPAGTKLLFLFCEVPYRHYIFFLPYSWDCDTPPSRPPLVIGAGPGILEGPLQSRLVPTSSDQTTLVALLGAGWGLRES